MNFRTTKLENSCAVLSGTVLQTNHAAEYANQLLSDLRETVRVDEVADHPALSWRRSGLLETTGLMLPLPLASAADGALMALRAISPNANALPKSGSQLMGERARLRGTVRRGRKCAGGYGRLMETLDGRIALNLVRDDDWDLIPAWLENYVNDWEGIERVVRQKHTKTLLERAAEIGLAVAEDALPDMPKTWFYKTEFLKEKISSKPLIVDLSGLWAGPLGSSLLMMTGAKVIKIESPNRPDGMRNGHKGFYELLNAGKDCAAFDFRNQSDLLRLKELINRADVVIEASRPRALPQLGIIAENSVSQNRGQIWLRLTAYGQSENRIGFGDDIGISAGLSTIMAQAHDEPCFVGDAIADPINGLHLALILRSHMNNGGGAVIDMSMRDCLRYAMGNTSGDLSLTAREWQKIADSDSSPYYPMRAVSRVAKPLGADTDKL